MNKQNKQNNKQESQKNQFLVVLTRIRRGKEEQVISMKRVKR